MTLIYSGYYFDYTDQLNKLSLDKLRLWSNDQQILETIHCSHCLAQDLAEYVGMTQQSNISIDINAPQIFIETHNTDITDPLSSDDNNQSYNENNNEYELQYAINEASL